MRITVWIVSGLLAVAFFFIGLMKVVTPAAELETMARGVPVILLKVAGTAEVLGALGLVLPALTRIQPILTPLAAIGLVVTMISATITNVIIAQYGIIPTTLILGALAGFVAWARLGRYRIHPRSAMEHVQPSDRPLPSRES